MEIASLMTLLAADRRNARHTPSVDLENTVC